MPILHLSQLIGVAAGLEDVGAEVQAPRRLGGAGAREAARLSASFARPRRLTWRSRWAGVGSARLVGRLIRAASLVLCGGAAGLRLVRGRLAADARARGAGRRASAGARRAPDRAPLRLPPRRCRRAAASRSSAPSTGWRSGGPTSSASPATCSPSRAASRCCAALLDRLDARSPCSATTTSPSRAIRSRSRSSSSDLGAATLLRDEARTVELRGAPVQIVGRRSALVPRGSPRPPRELADPDADLRILLSHFPGDRRRLPPERFELVLAGHMHAGQIVLPYPGGKLRSPIRARATSRASTGAGGTSCTSRRASARRSCRSASSRGPRSTELVLRSATPSGL